MGLMLGEYIDDYTVHVADVFAMPQKAMGVSVEAIDSVFQTRMIEMLKRIGRSECVVGWYHSHPGFGCWLSNVDISTQQSFETLHPRAVAVVVDPIQSVRGKVVIDAFRSIPSISLLNQGEIRSVTSNIGHVKRPPIISIIHGLNRTYYSLNISYRRLPSEQMMLQNLQKRNWMRGLLPRDYETHAKRNLDSLKEANDLLNLYETFCKQESELSPESFTMFNIGRKDPRKHLNEISTDLLRQNISQPVRALATVLAFSNS
ncbi:26S proteasome non-ATPase regulatory subunit 14 [Thelohanellus kitauei]|uniref:26S proteasome non-ATPase regulatory subunit 14 n=1 Tax=Thelohanellus kitauei TaxID=669202 RepID=A0A0C2MEN3_THEKT|nr:26S proteasome non-ATPase regulatory subunit 14 [Thelohanellus kitauei]